MWFYYVWLLVVLLVAEVLGRQYPVTYLIQFILQLDIFIFLKSWYSSLEHVRILHIWIHDACFHVSLGLPHAVEHPPSTLRDHACDECAALILLGASSDWSCQCMLHWLIVRCFHLRLSYIFIHAHERLIVSSGILDLFFALQWWVGVSALGPIMILSGLLSIIDLFECMSVETHAVCSVLLLLPLGLAEGPEYPLISLSFLVVAIIFFIFHEIFGISLLF